MGDRGLRIQKLAIVVLACFTLYSCKTELVFFNATVPAPVTIPVYVKKIGIINRSTISDSNNVRKKIDDVISLKAATLDKDGSNESIRGLKDALVQSNIFQNISLLDSVKLNNYPGTFPSPLSWDKISEICSRYNVDVLFALEMFHTDTKLNVIPALMSGPQSLMNGTNVQTKVSTGWRIYDPKDKLVLDEFPLSQGLSFTGSVMNPAEGVSALMDHKEVVMNTSYQLGQTYATRILPYTIRVCHQFYIRGSINFKMARRMADAGDWNNAADLWNKETNNPKPRIRARAFYNLAIISEMNGDIAGAIGWAKKAYETGGKRLALYYLNDLQDRAAANTVLNSQAH